MKCKNCGGELIFRDNIGVCDSCNSKFNIESTFENNEVCIYYIENDENGRRTRDSIIASEVYKRLESKKINTFYEHVSAGEITGDDLEMIRYTAIVNSKIIVLVGTKGDNFSKMLEKFADAFADKRIIPVISDMRPEELPEKLRGFQASNFDSIGALNDLSISILNMLGRGQEVVLEEIYNKQIKKKKTIIAVAISVSATLLCGAIILAVILFGGKKDIVLTSEDIYNGALQMVEDGKYLEAAKEFDKIIDFKDSNNQLKQIYDRYDGYYQDESQTCSLYLNIVDGKTVEINFEKIIEGKIIKIEESLVIDNDVFKGVYTDNLSNEGNISMTLSDQKISLNASTKTVNNPLSLGNIDTEFLLKNKTDRPPIKTVTKDLLLSWMSSLTYVDDIKTLGYELEYIPEVGEIPMNFGVQYKIVNTDITIVTTDEDLTKHKDEILSNPPKLEKSAVVAVIAPVNLVCSEKVGKRAVAFTNDEIIYVPNTDGCSGFDEYFSFTTTTSETDYNSFIVDKESFVGITSKKLIGEYIFNSLTKSNERFFERLYKTIVFNQFQKDNPTITGNLIRYLLSQNDKSALVCVYLRKTGYGINSPYIPGSYYYYKLDLKTEKAEFITEYSDSVGMETWQNDPELFGEFLTE